MTDRRAGKHNQPYVGKRRGYYTKSGKWRRKGEKKLGKKDHVDSGL